MTKLNDRQEIAALYGEEGFCVGLPQNENELRAQVRGRARKLAEAWGVFGVDSLLLKMICLQAAAGSRPGTLEQALLAVEFNRIQLLKDKKKIEVVEGWLLWSEYVASRTGKEPEVELANAAAEIKEILGDFEMRGVSKKKKGGLHALLAKRGQGSVRKFDAVLSESFLRGLERVTEEIRLAWMGE